MEYTKANVYRVLDAAFPSLQGRKDLQALPHEEWVARRPKLPRFLPEEVVEELPFILVDLMNTVDSARFADGDMVIYFLDGEPDSDSDNKFLVENIRQHGVDLSGLVTNLPQITAPYSSEAEKGNARMASFSLFSSAQKRALLTWLEYIEVISQYEDSRLGDRCSPEGIIRPHPFEQCRHELHRAIRLWEKLAHKGVEASESGRVRTADRS